MNHDKDADRVEVAFEVRYPSKAGPHIALVFSRDGGAIPVQEQFSFHLVPGMTLEEVHLLASALDRCVTHRAMIASDDDRTTGEQP